MKYVNYDSVTVGISKRCQAALVLIPFLQERYSYFYDNELYLNTTWLDPQYWQEAPNNRKDKTLPLINYFEVPLAAANFDKKVLKEWCSCQVTHASNITKILNTRCFNTRKRNSQICYTSRACHVFLIIEQCS